MSQPSAMTRMASEAALRSEKRAAGKTCTSAALLRISLQFREGGTDEEGVPPMFSDPAVRRTHANEIAGSNASMMTDASVSVTTSSTTSGAGLPSGRPRTTAAGIKLPSSAPHNEAS